MILIDCAPTESILTTTASYSIRHIIVPVKPEFLATIGLPLLARSLEEFRLSHENQTIDMAGIIFNDKKRSNTAPEQNTSCENVKKLANDYKWPVFENEAHHSDSYPTGSRGSTPIFKTDYARTYVINEFGDAANEFLKALGLK